MKISRSGKKPILAILVKRTALFFFVMCLLTVFIYGIGTVQEFMDITQLFLLRLSALLGIFLAVASFYGIILDFWLALYNRKFRYAGGAGAYMLLGIFGALIAGFSVFIAAAAGGNTA
jgi:hypothetical protein